MLSVAKRSPLNRKCVMSGLVWVQSGDASGFDDVGELEYCAGDGEDDVDLLGRRARIALEVDAAVDRLIGRDGDCLQMRVRCVGLVDLRAGCGWDILELRGWDVEEDFGFGREGFDAEVFGGEGGRGAGEVGDADVGAGVAAFVGEEDHDGEAVGAEYLVVVAEDGVVDAACVGLADDYIVGRGAAGQIGCEREGRCGDD
jgi:hypothetical protein